MLNDHRNRLNDPVIGRWLTRDPLFYNGKSLRPLRRRPQRSLDWLPYSFSQNTRVATADNDRQQLFMYLKNCPLVQVDASGLIPCDTLCQSLELTGIWQRGSQYRAATLCCNPCNNSRCECSSITCYSPQLKPKLSECPGPCIMEHERQRRNDIECEIVEQGPRKGHCWKVPTSHADTSALDCAAFTVHLECLQNGQCSNSDYVVDYMEYIKCMKERTCELGFTQPEANNACYPEGWDGDPFCGC